MNTNNRMKWWRFIVPKKVEQIDDYLFIDTYTQRDQSRRVTSRSFPVEFETGTHHMSMSITNDISMETDVND